MVVHVSFCLFYDLKILAVTERHNKDLEEFFIILLSCCNFCTDMLKGRVNPYTKFTLIKTSLLCVF